MLPLLCSAERPTGAVKGKQTKTTASCQPPLLGQTTACPKAVAATTLWNHPCFRFGGGHSVNQNRPLIPRK